jgi:SAM-dependent methyltransferase
MLTSEEIDDFYRRKLADHGPSAEGMGWRDHDSQEIRFRQLLKIVPSTGVDFTINDLGCGAGDLINLLRKQFKDKVTYRGYDAIPEMVAAAKLKFPESRNIGFFHIEGYDALQLSDYSVASGIFNVRNSTSDTDWQAYILNTLHAMAEKSSKGFAFNALTKYSDSDRMRPDLYYSDPLFLFDYCKRNFSRNVALLHDYGIYDFTILVRKDMP